MVNADLAATFTFFMKKDMCILYTVRTYQYNPEVKHQVMSACKSRLSQEII